ncbi:unnamed protein product, partial [marine sediment metagenome]
ASMIERKEAMKNIVLSYISNLIMTTPKMMNRLFGWDLEEVKQVLELLAQDGQVQLGVNIEGLQGNWIAVAV